MNDIIARRIIDSLKRDYDIRIFYFNEPILAIRIPKTEISQFDQNDDDIITKLISGYTEQIKSNELAHIYILADSSHVVLDPVDILNKIFEVSPAQEELITQDNDDDLSSLHNSTTHTIRNIIMVIHSTPIHRTPVYTVPVSKTPVLQAPIHSIPVNRELEITVEPGKQKDDHEQSDEVLLRQILTDFTRIKKKKITSTQMKSGRRAEVLTKGKRGRYVRYRMPDGEVTDIAIAPTIRAAAMHASENKLKVLRSDYREKVRRRRICTLINIVLDTSGSMDEMNKVEITSSVIIALLKDAYQRRDKVSLVTYSGRKAEVALPFTSSVERAKRYLETIPFGGTTPLASGIRMGLHVLHNEIIKDPSTIPIMILVTDGKANIPLEVGGNIHRELSMILNYVVNEGIHVLAVDMDSQGSKLAREISQKTNGRYFHPGSLSKESLYKAISDERDDVSYFAKI